MENSTKKELSLKKRKEMLEEYFELLIGHVLRYKIDDVESMTNSILKVHEELKKIEKY